MTRRPILPAFTVLTLSTLLAACGGGTEAAAPVTFDTLASGTVVVHNRDGGLWTRGAAWRPERLVRIGEEEGDDAYVFGWIQDVKLGPDGRVYVLDGQAEQVRIFDASGRHVRTVGREGGGPGEFRGAIALRWGPEGNLWVVDDRNQRYTVLSPAGDLVATYRRANGGSSYDWGGGFDARGKLYDPTYFVDGATHEVRRLFVGQRVEGDEVVPVDTTALPKEEGEFQRVHFDDGGVISFALPYTPLLTWAFDRDDGFWGGTGASYRLWRLTFEGDTSRIVELDRARAPVTDEERARGRKRIEDMFRNWGRESGLKKVDFSRIPDRKPAFQHIVLDDRGWIWVARPPASHTADDAPAPTTFDVFDPDGRYYGAVSMDLVAVPAPDIVGDRVAGVVKDALGVQSVVVYRLSGRSTGDR